MKFKQNSLVIILSSLSFIFLFIAGFFAYQTQKLSKQIKTLEDIIQTDNSSANQSSGQQLTFNDVDLASVNKDFYTDIFTLATNPTQAVSCLSYSGDNEDTPSSLGLSSLSGKVSDPNIIKFSQEIESHLYSDEQAVMSTDGKTSVINAGKKSKKEIIYDNICTSNGIYFFMFNTSEPNTSFLNNIENLLGIGSFNVNAAGGMWYPSNFAYSDKQGKLTIMENFPPDMSHIKLPPSENPSDFSIPTSTGNLAYYSCSEIYIANNSEVLVGCGGGDGPAGGGGIFDVKLTNQTAKEKAFCMNDGVGKYATICYDQDGKVYFDKLNK